MNRGTVLTARGKALNMEELILNAKRPMAMKGVDQKNEIPAKAPPVRQLNLRGFVPTPTSSAPKAQNRVVVKAKPEVVGPSLADLTAVTLDSPKRLKQKPENATQVANETLREIMGDLEQYNTRDQAVEPRTDRRGKKAS